MEQAASAIALLAGDEGLRKKLAAAARKTVERTFDWKAVMPRYAELWREQNERLGRGRGEGSVSATWKALDPAGTFAGFPSQRLRGASLLRRGPQFRRWSDLVKQPGVVVNAGVLTGRAQYQTLQKTFGDGHDHSVDDLLAAFAEDERSAVLRTLHWLIKVGLLAMAPRSDKT